MGEPSRVPFGITFRTLRPLNVNRLAEQMTAGIRVIHEGTSPGNGIADLVLWMRSSPMR